MAGSDVRLAPDSFSWADFRTLPLTTPEELKAEPETFLCVPAKENRAYHHAENLRQYRGTEAPVFYRRRSDADGGFL